MKVILAIDHSPDSKTVVDDVVHRAWSPGTVFKILTVVEPIESLVGENADSELPDEFKKMKERRHLAAERLCEKAHESLLAALPMVAASWEVKEGSPAKIIISEATSWQADRILLGAAAHDRCPRYLLGSVSTFVAVHAPCTVEIVRHERHAGKSGSAHDEAAEYTYSRH